MHTTIWSDQLLDERRSRNLHGCGRRQTRTERQVRAERDINTRRLDALLTLAGDAGVELIGVEAGGSAWRLARMDDLPLYAGSYPVEIKPAADEALRSTPSIELALM